MLTDSTISRCALSLVLDIQNLEKVIRVLIAPQRMLKFSIAFGNNSLQVYRNYNNFFQILKILSFVTLAAQISNFIFDVLNSRTIFKID